MILEQYYLGCLAHASYLIGDRKTATAAIVDPQRDVDEYIADAAKFGLDIRFVFLTHFHADFIAGHLELRDRTGATICLGARATAEFEFRGFHDGEELRLGDVRLRILETPGHTPESISLVVYDHARAPDTPYAVLTGDALFIGDVGRPDLMASIGISAEELAGMLYDTLHEKLLTLPDATLLYPAHGAGSLCGRNMSKETVSTIGAQRLYNYALQPMSKTEFIRLISADQPDAPDYFAYDADLNRRERATLETMLKKSLQPLSFDDVMALASDGAQLVDVREAKHFAGGHLAGSINIGLDGQFATWAGTVLDRDRAIVLVADPGREKEATLRLGRIGLDRVAGFLQDGAGALAPHPEHVARHDRMTARGLAERLSSSTPPLVLDVRTSREWQEKHIEGSRNLPLNHLLEHLDEVPREREVVVHCQGGYRSAIAVSLLAGNGFVKLADMIGGVQAWDASRLDLVADPQKG